MTVVEMMVILAIITDVATESGGSGDGVSDDVDGGDDVSDGGVGAFARPTSSLSHNSADLFGRNLTRIRTDCLARSGCDVGNRHLLFCRCVAKYSNNKSECDNICSKNVIITM